MKRILAIDFGASNGRAILSDIKDGKISMEVIHRFPNDPVSVNGTLYWDILRLFFEVKQSISKAVNAGGFDAICVDTWGVDFGLIGKDGKLISNPVHYRDKRTENMFEKVFQIVPKKELYARTGVQCLRINTLYQLMYLKFFEPEMLKNSDRMLMTPDLFSYMLTGEMHEEESIASTSNLFNPVTRNWDYELIDRLGLPKHLFAPIIKAGSIYGYLSDELCEELGCKKVPVIACPSHDTESVAVSTPCLDDDFVFISCGTWSLFGTESDKPILTAAAEEADFTNEAGFAGKTELLKNITGLWLVQESLRQWKREGHTELDFGILEDEALKSEPFSCFIDVDDPSFDTPGYMPDRIREYCRKTGQHVPETKGEVVMCIDQSLALKYKKTFEELKKLTGRNYSQINMLGGGIQSHLLCQLTADACGVKVVAGPTEATSMGSIAIAYYALGELSSLKEIRSIVAQSTELDLYTPDASVYHKFDY
ncbi:MAG: rhamnulokinase [Lachnospiraceae bacterium]|nr:rhamnulokinase [Candidatus Minthocola equi]